MGVSQRRVTMLMINTLPCSPSLSHRPMPSVPQHIPSLNQSAPDGEGRAGAVLSVPLSEYSSYTPFPKDPSPCADPSPQTVPDVAGLTLRGEKEEGDQVGHEIIVSKCSLSGTGSFLLFPLSRHCRVMVIILPPPTEAKSHSLPLLGTFTNIFCSSLFFKHNLRWNFNI